MSSSKLPNWKINEFTKQVGLASTPAFKEIKTIYHARVKSQDHLIISLDYETCIANANGNIGDVVMQYGQYHGKSFFSILENDAGYCCYLCEQYEGRDRAKLSKGNEQFMSSIADYSLTFESFARTYSEVVVQKEAKKLAIQTGDPGVKLVGFGKFHTSTYHSVCSSTLAKQRNFVEYVKNYPDPWPKSNVDYFKKYCLSFVDTAPDAVLTQLPDTLLSSSTTTIIPLPVPVPDHIITSTSSSSSSTVPVPVPGAFLLSRSCKR